MAVPVNAPRNVRQAMSSAVDKALTDATELRRTAAEDARVAQEEEARDVAALIAKRRENAWLVYAEAAAIANAAARKAKRLTIRAQKAWDKADDAIARADLSEEECVRQRQAQGPRPPDHDSPNDARKKTTEAAKEKRQFRRQLKRELPSGIDMFLMCWAHFQRKALEEKMQMEGEGFNELRNCLYIICQEIPYPYSEAAYKALDVWCDECEALGESGKEFVKYFRRTWGGDRRAFLHCCAPALVAPTTNGLERKNREYKREQNHSREKVGSFVVKLKKHIKKGLSSANAKLPDEDKPFDKDWLDYQGAREVMEKRKSVLVTATVAGVAGVQVYCVPDGAHAEEVGKKNDFELKSWAEEEVKTLTQGFEIREGERLVDFCKRIKRTRFLRKLSDEERIDERVAFSCTCKDHSKRSVCKHCLAMGATYGGIGLDTTQLQLLPPPKRGRKPDKPTKGLCRQREEGGRAAGQAGKKRKG